MKISLNWLGDFLPGPLEPLALGDLLTNAGLTVETFEKVASDDVMDVEVTSNRSDCLCHVGVARELAALLGRPLRSPPAPAVAESTSAAAGLTSVQIDAPDLCPHYTARLIRGVRVGPSPDWMVRRLEACLRTDDGKPYRSINNIVDITNYVMFETGQPLHAFDFDKLEGRRVVVRNANAGEKLFSIDGKHRDLSADMLVIADAAKPVALAGVMGGKESEITAGTTNVLLESARFDALSVRRTSRALALKSDSSYRFERGIDPTLPDRAGLRAAQLIVELAGGELLAGVAEAGAAGYAPQSLTLRLPKLSAVLGYDIPADEALDALRRLGFSPVLSGDAIRVTVPSHRLDVRYEIDLVEEVARLVGYGRIPVREQISITLTPPDPQAHAREMIRAALVAGGYFEALTFGFVSDALAHDFLDAAGGQSLLRADASVREKDARLRPSVLPGLLEAVARNESAGTPGARLFEIGSTFATDPAGKIEETRRVGLVGSADYREVRGVVEGLLRKLDAGRDVKITPDARPGFGKGACGRVEWGGSVVGYVGKIDRAVADKLSLRELPAAAELSVEPLLAGARAVPRLVPLSKFPAVRRDLSLVLDEAVRYEQVDSALRAMNPANLESLEYVTTYRGKPLAAGKKSVTVTLVFRASDATLTGEAVDAEVAKAVAAAREQLGAELRE